MKVFASQLRTMPEFTAVFKVRIIKGVHKKDFHMLVAVIQERSSEKDNLPKFE